MFDVALYYRLRYDQWSDQLTSFQLNLCPLYPTRQIQRVYWHPQALLLSTMHLANPFEVVAIFLALLVYTEASSSSVRNANATRTIAKQEEADKFKAASENLIDGNDDDIEAELGLAQAAEAESENRR